MRKELRKRFLRMSKSASGLGGALRAPARRRRGRAGPYSLLRKSSSLLFFLFLLSSAKSFSHPMGNFSVNRWTRLSPRAGGIDVTHVIDLAEIPTQKALSESNLTSAPRGEALAKLRDALARALSAGPRSHRRRRARGAHGREERSGVRPGSRGPPDRAPDAGPRGEGPARGRSRPWRSPTRTSKAARAGRKSSRRPGKGATLLAADVPASDRSRRLTEYPSDPAEPPSEVTRAALRVRFGAGRVR